MSGNAIEDLQKSICKIHGAQFVRSPKTSKIGVSLNVHTGITPINGLRHQPQGDSSGWYIWAGEETAEDEDFFKPLHISHLKDWCPKIEKFLGLAPGRFLIADGYEDVWFDESVLNQ